MLTHKHDIMPHNIIMFFQRWITAACIYCMLGVGTAIAAPIDDAAKAYSKGDYVQAFKLFRPLAAQGNANAQMLLGWMYRDGKGVTQDYREAVKWYRLAAAQGLADAQDYLGMMYHNGEIVPQDFEEALKWYRLAAAQGFAIAQFSLGSMYHKGQGVTRDDQEALGWYRLAAAQGDINAQYSLGVMYAKGYGITRDDQEALKWYRLAAAQGDEPAKEILKRPEMVAAAKNLATMQAQSKRPQHPADDILKKHPAVARYLQERDLNDAKAASRKGDYAQAIKILRPLAERGDASAQTDLGAMYRDGEGITQDYWEALKWYRLAAEQGNAEAQAMLGSMYHNGEGATQDYQEAMKWYRLAAAQGNVNAQFSLGWTYENGHGVTQDYQEAVKWYRLASAQGHELSKEILKFPKMVAAAQSLATGWVLVSFDGTFTIYADPATIRKTGNRVKMWDLLDYNMADKISGKPYMSIRGQSEYDCKEEKIRSLYATYHSENMARGEVISTGTKPSNWEPVAPGSMAAALWKIACKKR
ncbi:MAG: tetratricopeptide repeat protein [Nitrosomonadaceae bacterium]|nr:tetratricopeptide repeat protein [Nitrosomonadaceae bacterium]